MDSRRLGDHGLRVALLLALAGISSCTAGEGVSAEDDPVGAIAQPMIGGTASDASQDSVVLVLHHDRRTDAVQLCTGTLLAPMLVLTARHCVAETSVDVTCGADGASLTGGEVHGKHDPSDIYVFAGTERPRSLSLERDFQRGRSILDDGSAALCNADLALVVLATPVPSARVAPVRVDRGPDPDEAVTLVGWGIGDLDSRLPRQRQQVSGRTVLAIGPSTELGMGSAEFQVGEGPCDGDSGGPALAKSGAVVGVLSRGKRDGTEGAAGCLMTTSVCTAAASFRELLLRGYAEAGARPWLEGEPPPFAPEESRPPPRSSQSCGVGRPAGLVRGARGGAHASAALLALTALTALLALRRHRRIDRRQDAIDVSGSFTGLTGSAASATPFGGSNSSRARASAVPVPTK